MTEEKKQHNGFLEQTSDSERVSALRTLQGDLLPPTSLGGLPDWAIPVEAEKIQREIEQKHGLSQVLESGTFCSDVTAKQVAFQKQCENTEAQAKESWNLPHIPDPHFSEDWEEARQKCLQMKAEYKNVKNWILAQEAALLQGMKDHQE